MDGKFTGWHNHQCLRFALGSLWQGRVGRIVARGDALQDGDGESEGLAGTGLGLADEVAAGQGLRQRQCLDWEGGVDASGG